MRCLCPRLATRLGEDGRCLLRWFEPRWLRSAGSQDDPERWCESQRDGEVEGRAMISHSIYLDGQRLVVKRRGEREAQQKGTGRDDK